MKEETGANMAKKVMGRLGDMAGSALSVEHLAQVGEEVMLTVEDRLRKHEDYMNSIIHLI